MKLREIAVYNIATLSQTILPCRFAGMRTQACDQVPTRPEAPDLNQVRRSILRKLVGRLGRPGWSRTGSRQSDESGHVSRQMSTNECQPSNETQP
jgi:hypothetical protein